MADADPATPRPAAPCHFVAISTGQNIANVAPLLALARPADRVLWLSTPKAEREGWTRQAVQVLQHHGLRQQQTLALDGDDPSVIAEAMRAQADTAGGSDTAGGWVMVGNGGTKPQSLALWTALRDRGARLLYSEDQRCALAWQTAPDAPLCRQPYPPTPLRLDDVLALRGMVTAHAGKLLAQAARLTAEGAAAAADGQPYGLDVQATLRLHDQHAARHATRALSSLSGQPEILWPQVRQALTADRLQKLARTLNGLARRPAGQTRTDDPMIEQLANAVLGCLWQAVRQTPEQPAVDGSLGETFERAVARRFCRHLQTGPRWTGALASVHARVKVAAQDRPDLYRLEADLLLLLRNGILVAIESKSHDHGADRKELDARLLNLQRAGSQLARIALCSPAYRQASGRPWSAAHHMLAERCRDLGLAHLPFDLPRDHRSDSPETATEDAAPQWEATLDRLLDPYAMPLP